jgi:hypothetical protein
MDEGRCTCREEEECEGGCAWRKKKSVRGGCTRRKKKSGRGLCLEKIVLAVFGERNFLRGRRIRSAHWLPSGGKRKRAWECL